MEYRKISQQLAKDIMDKDENVVVIDIRCRCEYEIEHLKGAVCVPYFELDNKIGKVVRDKCALIFIYCARGVHSKTCASRLYKCGYRNVYDIGGIDVWQYDTYSEV